LNLALHIVSRHQKSCGETVCKSFFSKLLGRYKQRRVTNSRHIRLTVDKVSQLVR
jgi:hypothetical protein